MYFSDLTLNIMTLGGLALGAGMLVDNAIVVLENITRNREEGMPMKEAIITALTGGRCNNRFNNNDHWVFLPIVYLKDASSEMFRDPGMDGRVCTYLSLVVAMLVIPMLVSTLLPSERKKNHSFICPEISGITGNSGRILT
jgi:HAE1 family hydrophobic/amphiphilic exporter-1